MKIRRALEGKNRIDCIIDMARVVAQSRDKRSYSLRVEFALTEIVRDEMRAIAQQEQPRARTGDLLQVAVTRVAGSIDDSLEEHNIVFDLEKYVRKVQEKLSFPAREIQTLGERLAESRGIARLGRKEDADSESGRRYTIHELGLREAIQGLLVEPSQQVQELDIDAVREQTQWHVEGEWFPFEVTIEELVFVIDDDGSIFVPTANLPGELQQRVRNMIRRVADVLYG